MSRRMLSFSRVHFTIFPQEYPSKMRMKPLQTVHPLHGELMTDKKPKVTDPFFKMSCEEFYQPKPTSTENVLTKFKSGKYSFIGILYEVKSVYPVYYIIINTVMLIIVLFPLY